MKKTGKKLTAAGLLMGALLLVGCGSMSMWDEQPASKVDLGEPATRSVSVATLSDEDAATQSRNTDYLILINREHPIPKEWTAKTTFVSTEDVDGSVTAVEEGTFRAYEKLREALAEEGLIIGICSAYRSEGYQQELIDSYTRDYGTDYVQQYVAPVGCSEHHSGLALDLSIVSEDYIGTLEDFDHPGHMEFQDSFEEEAYLEEQEAKHAAMLEEYGNEDAWTRIHNRLADYGFILRYPAGKEEVTGYSYESWHVRYVGDPVVAHAIMDQGLTLEEYLGQ